MFDQVDALRQIATVGPISDITDVCEISPKPALPRALLEACQVLAWADTGNSNQSLAFTPTNIPTAPVERSLWAWVRSEAEYAAGHPLAAMRAAQDAADLQSAAAVLARTCAAWAALDVGEQVAQPPMPDESAGWMIRAAVQETRAVATLAEISAAGALNTGAAAAIAVEFTSLADIWEGWLVRSELRCRWAAADAARVAGAADAVELLRVAEHRAEQAGLSPLLQRVRRSLRLAGVRRVGRRTSNAGLLSARELEVIGLVGKGLSTRTISTQLGISPATVETQVASVMAKLGVRSRLQAALQAQRLQQ